MTGHPPVGFAAPTDEDIEKIRKKMAISSVDEDDGLEYFCALQGHISVLDISPTPRNRQIFKYCETCGRRTYFHRESSNS